MKVEVPELTRCCCCFPLRLGIIIMGYIKLCLAIFSLAMMIIICKQTLAQSSRPIDAVYSRSIYWEIFIDSIVIIVLICDIALGILFLVGGHKKNYKLMRIYYYYSIVILIIYALGFTAITLTTLIRRWRYSSYLAAENMAHFVYYLESEFAAGVFFSALQAYFIILIKSEIVKLKNNTEFSMENNLIEALSEQNNLENENNVINNIVTSQPLGNVVNNEDNLNSSEFKNVYVSIDEGQDALEHNCTQS